MAKRTSWCRVHKVRRKGRYWCVGYRFGKDFVIAVLTVTRSEANHLADFYDDAINHGDIYL